MSATNPYCKTLGIEVPNLAEVVGRPQANYFGLLIAALLERGEPITLQEAANRFEDAGVATGASALASLKRCRPGRPPIYRDGEVYGLDPHDHHAELWISLLGLRRPGLPSLSIVRPDPEPLPTIDARLTVRQLDEAWRDGVPSNSSAQRLALCVLDAHGKAMPPAEVVAFVDARSEWSLLSEGSAKYWWSGAAVRIRADGLWELKPEHDALRSARRAVRARLESIRRWTARWPDPAVSAARQKHFERKRRIQAEALAQMHRVIVHAFPAKSPEAIALADVAQRKVETFVGNEMGRAIERLGEYDIIAAVDVRRLLRSLDFDPGDRRLGELGPSQKTRKLNQRGRTLKITTNLLVQGSCGISRPFGEAKTLRRYLREGQPAKLRRRLEADAKSLFALYQYGRLHHCVRLLWGFLDEDIRAPWVHYTEPGLSSLMQQALDELTPIELVVGRAPGWADPWARAQRAYVIKEEQEWRPWLVDEEGYVIEEADVQLARLLVQSPQN